MPQRTRITEGFSVCVAEVEDSCDEDSTGAVHVLALNDPPPTAGVCKARSNMEGRAELVGAAAESRLLLRLYKLGDAMERLVVDR